MVLDPELGSMFFLGEIVTTLELKPDEPLTDHCGSCTRCLEACPTQAFPQPYQMDAARCISYLTIELRAEIPAEFQAAMGDWVFGCDICQDVCPFNRKAPITDVPEFAVRPPNPALSLLQLLNWTPAEYSATLRGSAMKRAKLDMLKRNAQIALQNAERSG
jgi:epoxyqueuosine reductase